MNRIALAFALSLCLWAPCYAQRAIVKGSTDQTTTIRIVDSADGTPETGVVAATSGLDLEYVRLGAAPVDLTESDLAATDSAHSDGGIKHLGNGMYRVDLPDAAVASGANEVLVTGACTGMVIVPTRHALWDFSPYTATPAVNVTQFGGSNGTFASGVPAVNTTLVEGIDATLATRGYTTVTKIGTSDNAETIIEAASAGTLIVMEPGTHTRNAVIAVPSGVDIIGYGATLTGDPGSGTDNLLLLAGTNRIEGLHVVATGDGHCIGTASPTAGAACTTTLVNVIADGDDDTIAFTSPASGLHSVLMLGGKIITDTWDGFSIAGAAGSYVLREVEFAGRWKRIYVVTAANDINIVVDRCSFMPGPDAEPALNTSHTVFTAQSLGAGDVTITVNGSTYTGPSYWADMNGFSTGIVKLIDAGGNDISSGTVATAGTAVSVATATLADNAITAAKIATDAIGASEIAASALGSAEIAADAFTAAKFASDVTTELQSGLATGSAISTMQEDVTAILADTGTDIPAAIAGVEGEPDNRDLESVQHTWTLRRSGDGTLRSTNPCYVHPGDTIRAGWNCAIPQVCPNGTIISTQGDPELVTASDDLTLEDPAIGHDAYVAKVEFEVAADAESGSHWIKSVITNRNGAAVTVYGEVVVQAEPE